MLENYFGLVEMVISFGIIIGLCLWQLWSVERDRKRLGGEQSKADEDH